MKAKGGRLMEAVVTRGDRHYLWCPGCEDIHGINDTWTWDGNRELPTISPSILVTGSTRCHSFVKNGEWQFLSDSDHSMAGTTVPVEPVPDWFPRSD